MTVQTESTSIQYSADGVTQTFAFDFNATAKDQIRIETKDSDGNIADYTSFSVALNSDVGGSVTTSEALADVEILIYRDTPLTQSTDYTPGGRFPAQAHEGALDKLTQQNQEQQESIGRSLKTDRFGEQYETGGTPFDVVVVNNPPANDNEATNKAYVDERDTETLAAAGESAKAAHYTKGESDERFINVTGDTMLSPLSGPASVSPNNYVPQYQVAEVVDARLGSLPSYDPQQFTDYGFVSSAVGDTLDYGSIS